MSIHLQGVTPGSLGEATLLVGDPGRIPLVTGHWQNVNELCRNREFVVCSGTYEGKLFSVCSTGIGLGSTEIAVLELIENGASIGACRRLRQLAGRYFRRCAAIQSRHDSRQISLARVRR